MSHRNRHFRKSVIEASRNTHEHEGKGMSEIPAHLYLFSDPVAHQDAVILFAGHRITVITSRLLRIEISRSDSFEDRASQLFLFRHQPVPAFKVRRKGEVLELETEHLLFRYENAGDRFGYLSISVHLTRQNALWRHGSSDSLNPFGTSRTLDDKEGPVRLGQGLSSRSGWSLSDDSSLLVFGEYSRLEAKE